MQTQFYSSPCGSAGCRSLTGSLMQSGLCTSAVSHLANVNCQRCHIEVYDFQDTQAMDAKQVICKMEVFKMGSCRAMRLIYLTINLVF